ncbi:MAG: cytochrome b/b6 domain-containing protein [Candidatus Eisenbacteria bacterium]
MATTDPAVPTAMLPAAPMSRTRAGAMVRVKLQHHALVRLTHWLNVPLLAGLVLSGLSIYWAAPVFQHPRDPVYQSRDYLADAGIAASRVLHDTRSHPRDWFYDHFSLGPRSLATALRLHWALAYPFMLTGLVYLFGLACGGGWRALLPRPSDPAEALAMIRFYLGVVPMALLRRPWPHPEIRSKYNALQRGAYFTVVLAGALVVASGWAMHKPAMLGPLERLFVSYDGARIVHFACMVVLAGFVIPHVILAFSDGWDTVRSMIIGWSMRVKEKA